MSGFMSAAMQSMKVIRQGLQIISQMTPATALIKPELFSLQSVRTNVRCYFPRPNEVKRVRRHGWEARMAKATGRRVIMRRILKGKHVLTH